MKASAPHVDQSASKIGVVRTAMIAFAIPLCFGFTTGVAFVAHAATPAKSAGAEAWHPSACPPPAVLGKGPSSVKVTGPCAFEHKGEAECEALGDDLMVIVERKAKKSAELILYVNVERYVGPGKYKAPNDIYVSLKDGPKIYRWWSNRFEVTVGPESKYVTLAEVHLEPEMVLVGCTGPQTNYQCDGRSDTETQHMQTSSTVSGTIYCKAADAKK
jgi:hypothetical protein